MTCSVVQELLIQKGDKHAIYLTYSTKSTPFKPGSLPTHYCVGYGTASGKSSTVLSCEGVEPHICACFRPNYFLASFSRSIATISFWHILPTSYFPYPSTLRHSCLSPACRWHERMGTCRNNRSRPGLMPRALSALSALSLCTFLALLSQSDAQGRTGTCPSEVRAASDPSARCAASFLKSRVCLPSCCCFKGETPRTTLFAPGGACFLERRIDENDVPQFRVLPYGPNAAGDCASTSSGACPSEACAIPGNDSAVLAAANPPSSSSPASPAAEAAGPKGESSGGSGGRGRNVAAPVAGGVAGLVLVALLAWVAAVFVRRRNVAKQSLQPPNQQTESRRSYGHTDLVWTLSTPTDQEEGPTAGEPAQPTAGEPAQPPAGIDHV